MISQFLTFIWSREAGRFLMAGALNTAIGYFIGVGAYLLLSAFLHITLIGLLASTVAILISFVNQRVWVFRSSDPWWPQLRRSFLVYGAISVIGTLMLWPLINVVGLSIWIAQGIVMFCCVGLSFLGQSRVVFKKAVP